MKIPLAFKHIHEKSGTSPRSAEALRSTFFTSSKCKGMRKVDLPSCAKKTFDKTKACSMAVSTSFSCQRTVQQGKMSAGASCKCIINMSIASSNIASWVNSVCLHVRVCVCVQTLKSAQQDGQCPQGRTVGARPFAAHGATERCTSWRLSSCIGGESHVWSHGNNQHDTTQCQKGWHWCLKQVVLRRKAEHPEPNLPNSWHFSKFNRH